MAGLIDVGESYKDKALSGFIRQSADQQRINETNKELEEADKRQRIQNVSTGMTAAISTAVLIAALL